MFRTNRVSIISRLGTKLSSCNTTARFKKLPHEDQSILRTSLDSIHNNYNNGWSINQLSSAQSRLFHTSMSQKLFWKSTPTPEVDLTHENQQNIIQSETSETKAGLEGINSQDSSLSTGVETANVTESTSEATKSMDLEEILRKDELKSIYQDLDFNDDSTSIFSYLDPTSYLAGCCEVLHNVGLPWWASIALTGVMIRLLASPLTVLNMRYTAKASHHQDVMRAFSTKKMELRRKNQRDKLTKVLNDEKKYRKQHGIELWKGFVYSGLQIPFFLAMFFSARHLLDLDLYPDMIEGGALWFTNLAEPSTFWGLPLITGIVQIGNSELQQRFGQMRQTLEQQHQIVQLIVRWGIRGVMMFAMWWMSSFESAYFCIWLPGAIFQFLLTIIQITPQGRKLFKIPEPYLPPRSLITKKKTGLSKFLDKLSPAKLATETAKEKPKLISQNARRKK